MKAKIVTLQKKKLIGLHLSMSLVNNRTGELWRSFMPRRHEVKQPLSSDFTSLQVYPPDYFQQFSPQREFEKWALMEVADFADVPPTMETFVLSSGNYAVFDHKGSDTSIFQYIYTEWIPSSGYALDDRPHFEILGEKYKNNDPESEEEIWIPIVKKGSR